MTNFQKATDAINDLFESNPDKVEQMIQNRRLSGWFVGQTMKRLKGEADPRILLTLVEGRLDFLAATEPPARLVTRDNQ